MLVISRQVNESIIINDDVTVTVLGVKGKQIRLGIDVPRDVAVHRKEIYVRIQKEKEFGEKTAKLAIACAASD